MVQQSLAKGWNCSLADNTICWSEDPEGEKSPRRAVETNQAMARAMANVRSVQLFWQASDSSPNVRLDQARISGNALELNGEALMPDGLRTLNALMLSLGQSALFDGMV